MLISPDLGLLLLQAVLLGSSLFSAFYFSIVLKYQILKKKVSKQQALNPGPPGLVPTVLNWTTIMTNLCSCLLLYYSLWQLLHQQHGHHHEPEVPAALPAFDHLPVGHTSQARKENRVRIFGPGHRGHRLQLPTGLPHGERLVPGHFCSIDQGGRQHRSMISILASGPSCPGIESKQGFSEAKIVNVAELN